MNRRHVLHTILAFAVAATAVMARPMPAAALELQQAKAQGLVGEQADGYLGVVKDAPGVSQLVDDINLQRRQLYRDLARRNQTSLQAVEAVSGQKLIERAASGEFVRGTDSRWVQKP